ncbi:MAG: S-adenosylmethionine decarboxylase, partial [Proteobacteria bacterium]|nr:S-adenosylmethionine decarboxylase [Pseudomonadota bacterium]
MNVLGLHLLLELRDCNAELLDDLNFVQTSLMQAADAVGAHVVGECFHH